MQDPWIDKLSDYLDDELSAAERAAVDAHLAACAECRRTLEDLARVVETARALTPRPPAHDLWQGVADRLASSPRDAGQSPRRISFTMPQLAAASLLLAAVTGALVWGLRAPGAPSGRAATPAAVADSAAGSTAPASAGTRDRVDLPPPPTVAVSFADAQYDAAVADLEKALANGRGRLDKSTIAVVEQNLQVIDRAIAQARQALESDPANSYLSSHLVETRRRKLDLLRRAAALTTESD